MNYSIENKFKYLCFPLYFDLMDEIQYFEFMFTRSGSLATNR